MEESTPHYKKGDKNQYSMVFSCPGQMEKANGHPVSGLTGNNLDILISQLNSRNLIFKRCEVTITNAWDKPLYLKESNRTEGSIKEILSEDNLNRLKKEIIHTEDILFVFGKKAASAVKKIESGLMAKRIIYLRHLSPRSINRITLDKNISEKRTEVRIETLTKAIIKDLNNNNFNLLLDVKPA